MRRLSLPFALLLALLAPIGAPLRAQTVDPGMSRADVVRLLGKPTGERSSGNHTYLFYRNGCERSCGMQDLVVLDDGKVTDAIFRAAGRRFSGTSSSPAQVPPDASRHRARASLPAGARRGGIVQGSDAPSSPTVAPAPRPRTVRGVAGSAPAPSPAAGDSGARAAAQPRTMPGPVRVPVLPRDTQIGVQPRERGQRTLPGPVRVPIVPRDTQVARPDSARKPRD